VQGQSLLHLEALPFGALQVTAQSHPQVPPQSMDVSSTSFVPLPQCKGAHASPVNGPRFARLPATQLRPVWHCALESQSPSPNPHRPLGVVPQKSLSPTLAPVVPLVSAACVSVKSSSLETEESPHAPSEPETATNTTHEPHFMCRRITQPAQGVIRKMANRTTGRK
jgi:hypothetical protein